MAIKELFERIGLYILAKFKIGKYNVFITAPSGGGGPDEAYALTSANIKKLLKIKDDDNLSENLSNYQKANWGYY